MSVACLLATAFLFAAPQASSSAESSRAIVATELTEVDEDFAFQGEYLGDVRAVDGRRVAFGLQVMALGNGRFSALGYQGGLPGNGWDQENFVAWDGSRQADVLAFHGIRGTVIIERGQGRVIDSAGEEVGHVHKVKRTSTTLGAAPPPNAIVLFDGTGVTRFDAGRFTPQGNLAPGAVTKLPVKDFRLHLEFQTPYMPDAREQGRGNSGVYIQRRYEVQILDSFGLLPENNDCGALYRQQAPDLNMTFPPLSWQTYDVYFTAARWDAEGNKTSPAQITLMHNGVPIHRQRTIFAKTGAGQPETAYDGPILLQDHGNPVQFRNVWLVAQDASPPPSATHSSDQTTICQSCEPATPIATHTPSTCPTCPGTDGWWLWRGF